VLLSSKNDHCPKVRASSQEIMGSLEQKYFVIWRSEEVHTSNWRRNQLHPPCSLWDHCELSQLGNSMAELARRSWMAGHAFLRM